MSGASDPLSLISSPPSQHPTTPPLSSFPFDRPSRRNHAYFFGRNQKDNCSLPPPLRSKARDSPPHYQSLHSVYGSFPAKSPFPSPSRRLSFPPVRPWPPQQLTSNNFFCQLFQDSTKSACSGKLPTPRRRPPPPASQKKILFFSVSSFFSTSPRYASMLLTPARFSPSLQPITLEESVVDRFQSLQWQKFMDSSHWYIEAPSRMFQATELTFSCLKGLTGCPNPCRPLPVPTQSLLRFILRA